MMPTEFPSFSASANTTEWRNSNNKFGLVFHNNGKHIAVRLLMLPINHSMNTVQSGHRDPQAFAYLICSLQYLDNDKLLLLMFPSKTTTDRTSYYRFVLRIPITTPSTKARNVPGKTTRGPNDVHTSLARKWRTKKVINFSWFWFCMGKSKLSSSHHFYFGQ